jgi:hypothetical protein
VEPKCTLQAHDVTPPQFERSLRTGIKIIIAYASRKTLRHSHANWSSSPQKEAKEAIQLLRARIQQHLKIDYTGSHLKSFVAGMKLLTDKVHKEEKLDTLHQTGTKVSFTPMNKGYQKLNDKTQCSPLATNVTATLIAG